jgi:formylmethanofuran dehydrogenase subunit E
MNIPTVRCNTCGCALALQYAKYKDTDGNTYCYVCYTRLLTTNLL